MKFIPIILFLYSALSVNAQKQIRKTILDDAIKGIQIDAHSCFEVKLHTAKTDEIRIEAQIEGEYSEDLEVDFKEEGHTLLVSAGFRPNFKNPNDKLSAHKVVSIALNIIVPQGKQVKLFGTNTNVIVTGKYKDLNVILSDGICELINVSQNVKVRTQSGTISISAISGMVYAKSKYGTIDDNPIPKGPTTYDLNTVSGDILLHKTE